MVEQRDDLKTVWVRCEVCGGTGMLVFTSQPKLGPFYCYGCEGAGGRWTVVRATPEKEEE